MHSSLQVPLEAAFIYDAVKVYAKSVDQILRSGGDIRNGTEVVRRIIEAGTYHSDIQGIDVRQISDEIKSQNQIVAIFQVRMDQFGDSEGNYILLGLIQDEEGYCNKTGSAFVTIGSFFYNQTKNESGEVFPVRKPGDHVVR